MYLYNDMAFVFLKHSIFTDSHLPKKYTFLLQIMHQTQAIGRPLNCIFVALKSKYFNIDA